MSKAYIVYLSFFYFTGQGLLVFLDIVHSYSAADEMVGLALFDGTNDCYFHTGIFFYNTSASPLISNTRSGQVRLDMVPY